MKSYIYILLALVLFSCGQKDSVTISGTYSDPIEGMVKIEFIENDQLNAIDSFYLEPSGKFERQVSLTDPGFYRINFDQRNVINLILYQDDIEIVPTNIEGGAKYKATGSIHIKYLEDLAAMQNEFGLNVQVLNEQFERARNEGNMEAINSLREQYRSMQSNHIKNMKTEIWKMDNSIAGILAISYFEDLESQAPFLDSLVTKYESQLPDLSYTINLRQQVDQFKKLAVGSLAPEINLPDPEGNNVSLSSMKGQYVLIDFWAAWCRPCRMENPNVVRMYNEYHDKGFEILGVSLDRKKEDWIKAIANDQLTWQHVSDLAYFNSKAASDYRIQAIPATYLIDPNGVIIGKNLRGPSLEAKLKEIFG
ncbi:MAG: TlpA family protein disulfide reductase [Reichenbachiella sp.]